jgi:tRNA dimethylallyltransferase
LKIGVAAPSKKELDSIRHHFIGHLSIFERYNVSRYETDVLSFLKNYFTQNRFALMTGGSGLYIDAVCKGIDDLPDPDEALRKSLKKELNENGLEKLIIRLKYLDPEYYQIVDKNNPNRILRALEVCLATGKPYSSLRSNISKLRNFNILKIGLSLPKDQLIEKIDKRVDQMIASGLVDEVKGLRNSRTLNALNTVGYKEVFSYLEGTCTLEKAVEMIKINTRRYAKRQVTWFKRDETINWFHPDDIKKILSFLKDKTNTFTTYSGN